jgi:ATP-dependent exoDNAse (exonuclease V) beta subunit
MLTAQAMGRRTDASYLIEASAGTGKTRALVDRIVAVLAAGVPIEGIVAVTFTHAAAGEMKLRVRHELERAGLGAALQQLDRAYIGTIHSFCAQLLRQRPVEAGVDPRFRELSQPEALAVFAGVFRRWVERKLASGSHGLDRALSRLAWMEDQERDPLERLRTAAWQLAEWRDHPAAWEDRPFDRAGKLRELLLKLEAFLAMRARCAHPERDLLYQSLQPAADLVDRVQRARSIGASDDNTVESELIALPRQVKWNMRPGSGIFGEGTTREAVLAEWNGLESEIEAFRREADASLAVALRDELQELVPLYQEAKLRAGQLDFMDLLIYARKLLGNQEARSYFQSRYTHLFVDEFQDTDPLQAEILILLSADNSEVADWRSVMPGAGKFFVVGDPKQSIYRFRRADVQLYRSISDALANRAVLRDALQSSRRSTVPLQEFVNAAFRDRMPAYLALTGGRPAIEGQPSVVALPVPAPFGARDITKTAVNSSSPVAAAAFIEWLVDKSGWKVSDPAHPEELVPIKPEHICILFRRFTNYGTDLTQEYVRRLEARRIRHVLVGSRSFHRREEIGTLRVALRAIEWPEDELSVFAVIRGGLFSVSDSTLLKFRHQFGSLHPFKSLPDDLDPEFAPIRDGLELLARLHRERNYRPVVETINHLLEHCRAQTGFAFRKGGERVLANVYRLCDIARSFELRGGATSFRSFVEYLEDEYVSSEAAEAPILEQQEAGVKLMTVHRAKGLEFPVVILADLTANLSSVEGCDRYVDAREGLCAQRLIGCAPWQLMENQEAENQADREEADRLAYVAATRARDVLAVMAVGEKPFEGGWLSPLYDAVYPASDRRRAPGRAPGCPEFGHTTVLNRPPEERQETSIKPGLHRPRKGTHEVVWFDPGILDLGERTDFGLAYEDLLKGTADVSSGLKLYAEWKERRRVRLLEGARPKHRVIPITELSSIPDSISHPVEVVSPAGSARTSSRRFGKLVHLVLEHAAIPADVEAIRSAASVYARLTGSPEREQEAAVQAAVAALAHPILMSVAGTARCHRELPVVLRLEDGRMAEGNIDLAFSDGAGWTVVDFKTGPADQKRYRRQLQVYAAALAQATGLPVRAILMEV